MSKTHLHEVTEEGQPEEAQPEPVLDLLAEIKELRNRVTQRTLLFFRLRLHPQ